MTEAYGPTSTCRHCGKPIKAKLNDWGFTQWNHEGKGVWASTCEPQWTRAEPIDEEPDVDVSVEELINAAVKRHFDKQNDALSEKEQLDAGRSFLDWQEGVENHWDRTKIKIDGSRLRIRDRPGGASDWYKWSYDINREKYVWVQVE